MMACRRQTNESLAMVKLGGNVLLTCDDPPMFRHAVAGRLAEEIKAVELPTIVLHGTGMRAILSAMPYRKWSGPGAS